MGCGCKKNKRSKPVEGERNSKLFKEQKEYRAKVNQAMKQLFDIKKRKR
tara:strand:- start:208 stop:354 length:147 start_codon:yes stop_codon:yes gene_type:complete